MIAGLTIVRVIKSCRLFDDVSILSTLVVGKSKINTLAFLLITCYASGSVIFVHFLMYGCPGIFEYFP